MRILVTVNAGPWRGTRALTAWRFARSAAAAGHRVFTVFFFEDGVFNALDGRECDAGTPRLARAWAEFSGEKDCELLLCSAAAQRRLPESPPEPWREAGLAEFVDALQSCDRVVGF